MISSFIFGKKLDRRPSNSISTFGAFCLALAYDSEYFVAKGNMFDHVIGLDSPRFLKCVSPALTLSIYNIPTMLTTSQTPSAAERKITKSSRTAS